MTNFKEATREALEFLRTDNNVGMIATVDSDNQPYLSPVFYVMSRSGFDLFFFTTNTTHKARNIEKNNKVAFTVGAGPKYKSVMIRGKASFANGEEQEQVLSLIMQKIDENKEQNWPMQKLEDLKNQNVFLYKITAERVTFLNLDSKEDSGSGDHLYHLLD